MKAVLLVPAAVLLLAGCAPSTSQLITLSSNNLTASPKQGFVYDNDTLRLSYQFFGERGTIHFTIENKLNKPLYIDWKRSAFIVGKEKMDYWRDEAEVNLAGTGNSLAYTRYWNRSYFDLGGTIRKTNAVDYIPPGTKLERDQFVVVPGPALVLPGQSSTQQVASTNPYKTKPVDVQVYEYNAQNSPLAFRNYLTLAVDKDFKQEFVLDSQFWASGVQVMPFKQLTGGQELLGTEQYTSNMLRNLPYYRADGFFLTYTPVTGNLSNTPR
ncbi:hypothetical protein ACAW74_21335 [Fibrella sp. WM1]|uniref:hypothetical protein n=1 Tax=Fibrella musci TaxID=3242485 RepID=UPI0035223428